MHTLDYGVILAYLLVSVGLGIYFGRNQTRQEFFAAGNSMGWLPVGLSVMATQASAITFLSTPGQAYESGMAFVQNYLGMPIALIIVSAVFLPIYYKLKVYTAYEYLETRFDIKTRSLAAFLFLTQRAMGA